MYWGWDVCTGAGTCVLGLGRVDRGRDACTRDVIQMAHRVVEGQLGSWVCASERPAGGTSEGRQGAALDVQGRTMENCACWGSTRGCIEGAVGVDMMRVGAA